MKQWQKPQLTSFGTISDITKGKMNTGTDAFAGGQPQPVGSSPVGGGDMSSTDGILGKWD